MEADSPAEAISVSVTFPDPGDVWPIVDHCAMEPHSPRYWFAAAEVRPTNTLSTKQSCAWNAFPC